MLDGAATRTREGEGGAGLHRMCAQIVINIYCKRVNFRNSEASRYKEPGAKDLSIPVGVVAPKVPGRP
jgi:hypothetical protein